MITIFDTKEQFNTYTDNGQNIPSGFLYYVKEDETVHFNTNNIDGTQEIKNGLTDPEGEGYLIPTGDIEITENGENIDVAQYETASVAVPLPTGNVEITENGTNIDVYDYATATVAVPDKQYICVGSEITSETTGSGSFILDSYRAIKKVIIPNGYTSIGNIAFFQNYEMTDVTIPNTVTSIGNRAFGSCNRIDTLTIPDSVTSIGYDLMENTDSNPAGGVKHIVIGSGLASVATNSTYSGLFGAAATRRCQSITVDSNNATYDSRDNCNAIINTSTNELLLGCNNTVIPNTVTSIGSNAFRNCLVMTSITIPSSVTSIGERAFYKCTGLTGTLTIPNSVTSIGLSAFADSTMTSVTIGNGITSIGNYAFSYNYGGTTPLTSVTVQATTPPTLGSNVFYGQNSLIRIYVPAESVDTYKAASGWSSYASRIQAIPGPSHDSPL